MRGRGDYGAAKAAAQDIASYDQTQETLALLKILALLPDRGAHPPELLALGIRDFRQTGFRPYRVIYRVGGDQMVIHLIVDGRRDLPSLLGRRLLGA